MNNAEERKRRAARSPGQEKHSGQAPGLVRQRHPVRSLLVKDENIIDEARVHWAIFVAPFVYAMIGLLVAAFFHPWVGGFILFLDLVPTINALILYLTTYLVVTNKRIFARYGFFNRDLLQMRLDKLESAHLEEPLLGQILGYATVIVRGTGTGSIPVPYIADGHIFVKQLEEYILSKEEAR